MAPIVCRAHQPVHPSTAVDAAAPRARSPSPELVPRRWRLVTARAQRGTAFACACTCVVDARVRLGRTFLTRCRVWADLDDSEPANADLTALTLDMPISCRDNTYPEFIDHIVVDRRVRPWVDRTPFRQVTYRQADKGVWDQLSDHCPVQVELWVR